MVVVLGGRGELRVCALGRQLHRSAASIRGAPGSLLGGTPPLRIAFYEKIVVICGSESRTCLATAAARDGGRRVGNGCQLVRGAHEAELHLREKKQLGTLHGVASQRKKTTWDTSLQSLPVRSVVSIRVVSIRVVSIRVVPGGINPGGINPRSAADATSAQQMSLHPASSLNVLLSR